MSSHPIASARKDEPWRISATLTGAALWATVATLAGFHRVPFGILELLILLAVLVIAPLGLALTYRMEDTNPRRLEIVLCRLQIVASLAACNAIFFPCGRIAGFFGALWLLYCVLLAGWRMGKWRSGKNLLDYILDLAYIDLAVGAAWLFISRAGWRPMGFQEPIIALTAIHFHYSGFGMAVIAAATLAWCKMHRSDLQLLRLLLISLVLLPFVVAAGFVFSPVLRWLAALFLSIAVSVFAIVLLSVANHLQNVHARLHLRVAAGAVVAGMALSGTYAVSEYFGKGWITIPRMANTHGLLNGLGFVMLGLLAWLTELNTLERDGTPSKKNEREQEKAKPRSEKGRPVVGSRDPGTDMYPLPIPEFVARDFYDR